MLKKNTFIKNTFSDIFSLFTNFVHWNISKIIIFIWSIVVAFIFVIPFIIALFLYAIFSNINIPNLVDGFFYGANSFDLIGILFLYLIIAVFFIGFSYSNILMFKLNLSYIDGEKLDFKKNEYFNLRKIGKYINITLINIGILLLPIIGFLVSFSLLYLIAGGEKGITILLSEGYINYFSIISLKLLIFFIIIFLYLFIRLSFSYLILIDDKKYKKEHKSFFYIKEAFRLTKNLYLVFKLILVSFLIIIIIVPFLYLGQVIENNNILLNKYNSYINLDDKEKAKLDSVTIYELESMELEFTNYSKEEIINKAKYSYYYLIIYTIFNFLVLNGLLLMVYSSYYRRELLK